MIYKVLSDIQVSPNFHLSEFECHDGNHEVLINPKLLVLLQQLRDALQKPITIAAAYRNKVHNAAVGGSPTSLHMLGEAVDIKVLGMSPKSVATIALNIGFNGIGVYTHNGDRFTHIDVRPVKSIWMDQPGKGIIHKVASLKEIPD